MKDYSEMTSKTSNKYPTKPRMKRTKNRTVTSTANSYMYCRSKYALPHWNLVFKIAADVNTQKACEIISSHIHIWIYSFIFVFFLVIWAILFNQRIQCVVKISLYFSQWRNLLTNISFWMQRNEYYHAYALYKTFKIVFFFATREYAQFNLHAVCSLCEEKT